MEVKLQKTFSTVVCFIFMIFILLSLIVQAQNCRPTGYFRGTAPPPGKCNQTNCCKDGQVYTTFHCSPQVGTAQTKAKLSLKSFEGGGNGGASLKCRNQMHPDDELPVVALSTGWYDGGSRCEKYITVSGNGMNNVRVRVVDECDSTNGCDAAHNYQAPCGYNVVAASKAVWKALGVPEEDWGTEVDVYWSDA